jgi:hypothetical protein
LEESVGEVQASRKVEDGFFERLPRRNGQDKTSKHLAADSIEDSPSFFIFHDLHFSNFRQAAGEPNS